MGEIPEYVTQMMAGDEAGMGACMGDHGRWVYGKAYRILGNHEDALEAWQDVFVKVWAGITQWDREKGTFAAWMNCVARNSIIDYYRKRKREREREHEFLAYEDDGYNAYLARTASRRKALPDEEAASAEFAQAVVDALPLLRNKQHSVAWRLRHLEHLPTKDVAAVLGAPENTVKVWIHRANLELRGYLREYAA